MKNLNKLWFVLFAVLVFCGCKEEEKGGGGAPITCAASAECEDNGRAEICVGGTCRECQDDAGCAADPQYGQGATCQDGQCVTCRGEVDCACDPGGECQEGLSCVAGVCQDCLQGEEGCVCLTNGSCLTGLQCEDEVCVPCEQGSEGCGCDVAGDDCGDGLECVNGQCVAEDCDEGSLNCACEGGESCDEGLRCDEEGRCVTCTSDVVGCPCDPAEGEDEAPTCQDELVCDEDEETCREASLCADLSCAPFQLCEEGAGVDAFCVEGCEEGFRFDPETRTCVEGEVVANCDEDAEDSILAECQSLNRACEDNGEGAACGGCLPRFVEEGGSCRAAQTCADIDCTGVNRACVEGADNQDAACQGDCVEGFREVDGECQPLNCNDDAEDPNSILADCNEQNRACAVDGGVALCRDCVEGFRPNDDENNPVCVPIVTCADRAEDEQLGCDEGEFCVDRSEGDSLCTGWPCLDEANQPDFQQAFNQSAGRCVDCPLSCDNQGEVRLWPFTVTNSDRCICETEPGFFFDPADALKAVSCDADSDGWVNRAAQVMIEDDDRPNLQENARCDVREVERFRLHNEWGQTQDVYLCRVAGLSDEACELGDQSAVSLYEPAALDDQVVLEFRGDDNPALGSRPLRTSELNPLTKACIDETSDININTRADLNEWHGLGPVEDIPGLAVLMNFTYYVELHRAWFSEEEGVGVYHIQEKSRCDADFPVQGGGSDNNYWSRCNRFRDADFDIAAPDQIGMDFARWTCGDDTGACPQGPIVDSTDELQAPPHNHCDTTLGPDEPWRGMHHHSQFRCVAINPERGDEDPVSVLGRASVDGGEVFFNRCQIVCPEDDPGCAQDCEGPLCQTSSIPSPEPDLNNPRGPRVECVVETDLVSNDDVGFVAMGYNPTSPDTVTTNGDGEVERGCIDESMKDMALGEAGIEVRSAWRDLCPGHAQNPAAVQAVDNARNFGELFCGCDYNYGGIGCSNSCSGANPSNLDSTGQNMLHYGGDSGDDEGVCDGGYCTINTQVNGRTGIWMCGEFTRVAYSDPGGRDQSDGFDSCGENSDQPCIVVKAQAGDNANARTLTNSDGCLDDDDATPCIELQ